MATRSNRLVPAWVIHPGEILRDELQERGIKQEDFAQMIGVQPTYLNEFIKGKRDLNEDLATKLEKHLSIPVKTWMNLQYGLKRRKESNMANKEKAHEIVNNQRQWIADFIEKNNLSRVKMHIAFKMYIACSEMAQWKDEQFAKEKQELIDKACEWMKNNMHEGTCEKMLSKNPYPCMKDFIEEFKKAMKGE